MLRLECFKAGKGDSFLLTWGETQENNILIDAGVDGTYRFIRLRLIDEAKLDAILITHVDYDHIGGFFKLLADSGYQLNKSLMVFLNTPSLILSSSDSDLVAVDHGVEFEQILHDRGIKPVPLYLGMNHENKVLLNGLELQILSPTKQVIDELIKQWTASEIYQQY
jgi:glyoxylase-like metal-dependent hydrolase (beta-lactamase superfamily II)